MTTKEEGILGEAKVLSKFTELGVPISIPFGDNCSYDLIAEFNGKLQKIQVKTSAQTKNGCTSFRTRKVRINRNKNIIKNYTKAEVDYYALYSIKRDKVFLVKFEDVKKNSINIRFEEPKNKQGKLLKFEEDYLIDNVITY